MNFEIESGLMKRFPMILGILFFLAGITYGQDNAKDVNSVDAIITALYESISSEAGERDLERFRSLFAEDAHLIPTRKNQEGVLGYRALSPQDYIENVSPYFKKILSSRLRSSGLPMNTVLSLIFSVRMNLVALKMKNLSVGE